MTNNIGSDKIKLFPVAKERSISSGDSSATLFTETNLVAWISAIVDKKVFVVSGGVLYDSFERKWSVNPSNDPLVLFVDGHIVTIESGSDTDGTPLLESAGENLYVTPVYIEGELKQDEGEVYTGITFSDTSGFLVATYDSDADSVSLQKYKYDNSSVEDNWQESIKIKTINCIREF